MRGLKNQVVTSAGDEVFFKIKRNTKLTKLRSAYAQKVGKDLNSIRWIILSYLPDMFHFAVIDFCMAWTVFWFDFIRFLYDGNRINDDDTPASLDMEDNDTIDVMVERT